ncbi:hypothetical protein F4777DRAFT_245605 [Nemania sp. FL0916]|nr:hypothetical protein F4777DRAFT_245605 [Nemania sp. FL0916]
MSPPTSKNPSALPAAPRHRPSSAVPPTTTTLTSQPHSRGSTQPLPQYYIQRPGSTHHTATGTVSTPGTNVPLIAADQLPAWVDVLGVPRELSPEQTATLSSLGTVPKGGSYELYISPAGLSTAAAAAVPGSMGKQQQQQPVKQKGLAASRHNPVNSGSGGGGGNGGSGGHSGQQAMNSTGRTTSAPGIGSVSRNHHRPQTGLHERQAPPAPPATRPSNPYPVMWTTAAARQRRYEARRRAHAQAGLQRQRQRSLPLHPVERLRALYTATASTLRNARSGSAENNNSSPPIIPPRSPSSSSSLMSFSSSSSSSSSCSSSSSSSAASTTTKTPQKHSKSSIGHTKEKKNDKKKDEEKEKEKEKGKEKNRDNTSSSSSAQKSQKASSNNASNNTSNNSSSNGGRQTTSYCRNWCRTGRCRFGARCRYLHMMPRTAQELRDAGLTDYPRWWLTHLELMAQYVQDLPVSASAATKEGTGESPLELLEDMMMMTMPGFFPAPSQGAQQQGQQPPRNHARVQALMQQIIEATASSPLPSASSASHSSSGRGEKQKEKPAASAPQKQEQQKHRRGRGAKDAENENERAENYPHSGSSSRSNEDGPAASTAMSKVKVKDKDNNGLQNGANDTVVAKAAKKPSSKESDHSGETRGTACAVPPSPKHMNTSGSNNVSSNTIVPTDTARSPSHNAAGIREGGSGGGEGGKSMATSTLVSETVSAAGGVVLAPAMALALERRTCFRCRRSKDICGTST